MAIAFDGEHRVDEVFEGSRSGQSSLLGDVTDQHYRGVVRLSHPDEQLGATAYLRHAPWWAIDVAQRDRLDRVHHHEGGVGGRDSVDDGHGVGRREDQEVLRKRTEAFGPESYLLCRLFGRDQKSS